MGESGSNGTSQRSSPEPDKEIKLEIDESIPDCTNWTCQDVYDYFHNYVGSEDAEIFRDQEIDGKALLLLARCDVLSDLKLKLGPALKIYSQIRKLQVRRGDYSLFWP